VLTKIRSRMTYANVLATAAVVVAVGAGGYAIGSVPDSKGRIPACYVTTGGHKGELRVLLHGKQCRSGERKLVWNRRGVQGLQGSQGLQGATGPQGIPGPAGPSEGFNQGLFAGGPGLSLSAGGYFVQAVVQATNSAGTPADLSCTLSIGSASDGSGIAKDIETTTIAANGKGSLTLHQIHTLSGPGPANVSCTGPTWNGLIVALRVGTVHEI
jgi:hypothetical protein